MRVIYFNARGSRHILGGDFRLFQSGSHLSFLRHIDKEHCFSVSEQILNFDNFFEILFSLNLSDFGLFQGKTLKGRANEEKRDFCKSCNFQSEC